MEEVRSVADGRLVANTLRSITEWSEECGYLPTLAGRGRPKLACTPENGLLGAASLSPSSLSSVTIAARLGAQRLAAGQALGRPGLPRVVVFGDCRRAFGQHDPGLLGGSEDVDVGRQAVGIVERADAHEAHGVAGTAIVAPHRDAARGAAPDLLAAAARRRRHHRLRLAAQQLDAIGLDHGVERECRAGLALAPAAVTAMHEQRLCRHAISDLPAGAAAFVDRGVAGHDARLPAKVVRGDSIRSGERPWRTA